MHAVFLFDSESADRARGLLEDDLVSRQSITLRDPETLGLELEGLLVFIEGDERAIARFEEIAGEGVKKLEGGDVEKAYGLLKQEEEDAAEGVGFLFG